MDVMHGTYRETRNKYNFLAEKYMGRIPLEVKDIRQISTSHPHVLFL
jgi:hypothetical protein